MDRLWAHSNIDFVGINNYFPISDWRNYPAARDRVDGFAAQHDTEYLQSNVEGGEHYDWHYPDADSRNRQERRPLVDAAYGENWVMRLKDLRNWWKNAHYDRVDGVRKTAKTPWVPRSIPIVFTEIGFPAVDKGANEPDTRIATRGSKNDFPHYSSGRPDSAIQRAALESVLRYWRKRNEAGFIEYRSITAHMWDVRPYPTFPNRAAVYADTESWLRGHWLTGRLRPGMDLDYGDFGPFAFTDAEFPITRNGIVYQPWPIQHSEIVTSGDLDKSELTVKLAIGSGIENEFIGFPPSQVVNLTIFQGQMDDEPTLADYPAVWLGRINAPEWMDNEISFSCLPVSSSLKRPGLRRNYQLSCPHVLYGPDCKASKRRASVAVTVQSFNRSTIRLAQNLTTPETFPGGLVEWLGATGRREVRAIVSATATSITVRGTLRGLAVGTVLTAAKGCDHALLSPRGCALHDNFPNFGGQPLIPTDNPLSQKNQFY